MAWLILFFGVALLLFAFQKPPIAKKEYLEAFNQTQFVASMSEQQAFDMASLSDRNWQQRVKEYWLQTEARLGQRAKLKVAGLLMGFSLLGQYLNKVFFQLPTLEVEIAAAIIGLLFTLSYLKKREQKRFEASFPDALNMLTSAVSSGESITHAIAFVGNKLSGDVGKEFKLMAERLQLGEAADDVFRKSCRRFPYPSFQFFIITLRANLSRGGQLKDVMSRLNRLMFEARAADKKKYALTSEARISAKIVCAMPFIFLFILQFINRENFDFVMFDERGRPILYYVLASEAIGMAIIWLLMKGVRT